MKKIPVIIGATSVGKTNYSIGFALENNLEIISADSMQVYKQMNIGTAKPTKEEMGGINHHLMDIINPDEEWNLFKFVKQARQLLFATEKNYLVVGGTGLYIKALINNYGAPESLPDEILRSKYLAISSEKGVEALHNLLKGVDAVSAEKIKPRDEFRIIRALEVYEQTGIPFSQQKNMDTSFADKFRLICLDMDRALLYKRIGERVDKMVEKGLFTEVQMLLDKGYSKELTSMQALGYKEVIMHFEGLLSKADCLELIKKKTRNFAKRQLTWYRSFPNVEWITLPSQL
ncbi:MAG: tRNA (adenosine(37)-N6)-dimethylallyltransferase MiaA [Candidatus Margulisbacteria bacterium]|nr:tRNA (adenosine(37)-N6)-dimethylallyltransferase MiaA [Candidatus Margulisiibacteriota bacterium]